MLNDIGAWQERKINEMCKYSNIFIFLMSESISKYICFVQITPQNFYQLKCLSTEKV